MTAWGRDKRRDSVDERIEDAVFSLMSTTDIPEIHVGDVARTAGISRSTFYRHFDSVDDVVKGFETDLLANMHDINNYALKGRFGQSELDPTPTMIRRMELLAERRDKVVALNGPHGDPQFVHKATVLMHDHFRDRLADVEGSGDFLPRLRPRRTPQRDPVLAREAPGRRAGGRGRRPQPTLLRAVLPRQRDGAHVRKVAFRGVAAGERERRRFGGERRCPLRPRCTF